MIVKCARTHCAKALKENKSSERQRLSITRRFVLHIFRKCMSYYLGPSGRESMVHLSGVFNPNDRLCLFSRCSERRTAILARTMHSRSHLQTACRRCSVPVLPTRDIHHVPRCQSWMGKLSHCDVRYLLDHVIITLK